VPCRLYKFNGQMRVDPKMAQAYRRRASDTAQMQMTPDGFVRFDCPSVQIFLFCIVGSQTIARLIERHEMRITGLFLLMLLSVRRPSFLSMRRTFC